MKLSKNFTLDELIKSPSATRWGFEEQFTPTQNIVDNLTLLCNKVLQPIRDILKDTLTISSGYRCPRLNAKIGGAYTIINGKPVQSSQHCFDDQTEILTEDGWKSIKDIDTISHVYSLNTQTNNIELVEVSSKIIREFDGTLIGGKNAHIDFLVTDEHRMYCVPEGRNNPEFRFELAKDIFEKRRTFYTAGKINSDKYPENLTFLKLCMATIADGCVKQNTNSSSVNIVFSLVKQKEISTIEEYLNELNITYYKSQRKENSLADNPVWLYTINAEDSKKIVSIIGLNKKIPKFILEMSPEAIYSLFVSYANFDGSFDFRDGCSSISITSIDKDNIDVLRTMSILCGRRCTMSEGIRTTNFGTNYFYTINSSENNTSRLNEDKYYIQEYKGFVWCLNNKNTTLIIKRNNKISIQGNCYGQAADINYIKQGAEHNNLILAAIKELMSDPTFHFDQCIVEFGTDSNPAWVHISYSEGKNRMQVLRAYKSGKKTLYKEWKL
jgi:hypothetical protein